jgi:hypothetical protein
MRTILLLMLVTMACFHGSAQANMRAPYSAAYSGSGEIHSSIDGLVAMKEELDFDCDFPYRGSLDEVRGMRANNLQIPAHRAARQASI